MYKENDLVRIAKRENNTKRSYLVVDPLQGKHVPVSPKEVLSLFDALAELITDKYDKDKLLLIGFCETATAIGAEAAVHLGTRYTQTTREIIPGVEYLFFSEEHSHATEQKLIKNDIDSVVGVVERIVFVEDEVTTGNTILNIIRILDKLYPGKFQYSVLSLLNGMQREHISLYESKNIDLHYLVKTDHSSYSEIADQYKEEGQYNNCVLDVTEKEFVDISVLQAKGYLNTRRLTDAKAYKKACDDLSTQVVEKVRKKLDLNGKKILVLGTEEFMYPAIYVGSKLEEMGNVVRTHATTRSPISVYLDEGYPLTKRFELRSLYEDERRTFIYNLDSYDQVIVLTDSERGNNLGLKTLYNALSRYNDNILVIRWC